MSQIHPETVRGWVTLVIAIASILHTVLPPWESFGFSPRFQAFYRVVLYFLAYPSISLRSTVHPSISTQDGTQVSQAAQTSMSQEQQKTV